MKKVKKNSAPYSLVLAAIAVGVLLITSVVIGVSAMNTSTDSRSQASEEIQNGPIVYRLIHEQNGNIWLTIDKAELHRAITQHGYRFQQAAFRSVAPSSPGAAPVYRLWNVKLGTHSYTIDPKVRRELVKKGYQVDGVAFHAFYPQGTQGVLVTQFYNKSTKKYDYRLNDEIQREGYEREGGAFRVINIGWPR